MKITDVISLFVLFSLFGMIGSCIVHDINKAKTKTEQIP